jgi:hypothetical protein
MLLLSTSGKEQNPELNGVAMFSSPVCFSSNAAMDSVLTVYSGINMVALMTIGVFYFQIILKSSVPESFVDFRHFRRTVATAVLYVCLTVIREVWVGAAGLRNVWSLPYTLSATYYIVCALASLMMSLMECLELHRLIASTTLWNQLMNKTLRHASRIVSFQPAAVLANNVRGASTTNDLPVTAMDKATVTERMMSSKVAPAASTATTGESPKVATSNLSETVDVIQLERSAEVKYEATPGSLDRYFALLHTHHGEIYKSTLRSSVASKKIWEEVVKLRGNEGVIDLISARAMELLAQMDIDFPADDKEKSWQDFNKRKSVTGKEFGVVRQSFSSIGERRETSGVTAILNNAKIDAYLKQRKA